MKQPAAPAGWSLRRRLVATILGATAFMWLVSLALVVHLAWRETSEVFDDSLKEGARLTLVLGHALQAQGALAGADQDGARAPARVRLYYQIIATDGRVLRRAAGAPDTPFLPVAPTSDRSDDSDHANAWAGGQAWRVYRLRAEGSGFEVQVGQPWSERLELLDEMAGKLLGPALAMLAVLGGFCWLAIRRLLRPLEQTAANIAAKSPQDLQAVPFAHEPRELQPIVQGLNLVLGRLDTALQAERRFTADAAHELRTPLAGLRMRIQLLQRQQALASASGDDHSLQSLQSLRDDVDRCTALVDSLLTLARLDPESPATLAREPVDLPALFGRLAPPPAALRSRRLTFEAGAASLLAQPALLESALRNLIDNALRYSPDGSRVQVRASLLPGGGVRLAVSDDGPGVSSDDQARLTQRFFRGLGSGQPGSGLGLSIVARIAALHGATLHFGPGLDGRGLAAMLDFAAP